MRAILLATAILLTPVGRGAEPAKPAKPDADPWVGEYFKHERRYIQTKGSELETLTIKKHADGTYRLGKHYESYKFAEVKTGVLSDGKGGIGTLTLGEAKFADGTTVRIIKADFCYEQFTLMDPFNDLGK